MEIYLCILILSFLFEWINMVPLHQNEISNNNYADEMCGTRLNGYIQTTMDPEKENCFLLPRPLKPNDQIKINGNITNNNDTIHLKLMSDSYPNIIYQIKIDYANNATSYANSNGVYKSHEDDPKPSETFSGSNFSLIIDMQDNGRNQIVMVLASMNTPFEELALNETYELEQVKYMTLSNTVNVTELSFMFNK